MPPFFRFVIFSKTLACICVVLDVRLFSRVACVLDMVVRERYFFRDECWVSRDGFFLCVLFSLFLLAMTEYIENALI